VVGFPEPLTPFRQDQRALFSPAAGARIRNGAGGSDIHRRRRVMPEGERPKLWHARRVDVEPEFGDSR
jgi:hypothetical protein